MDETNFNSIYFNLPDNKYGSFNTVKNMLDDIFYIVFFILGF